MGRALPLLLVVLSVAAAADELQETALRTLWEALNGPNESVARAAAVSLSERGPEGLTVLVRGLKQATPVAQRQAAVQLADIGHRAAIPHIIALLGQERRTALAAAQALRTLGAEDQRVTKRLVELARYGAADMAEAAEGMLRDGPQTAEVLDFFQSRLGAGGPRWPYEHSDVAEHLARNGAEGKKRLLAALRSPNAQAQAAALHGLAQVAEPEDIPAIAAVVAKGGWVAESAVAVLGVIEHPRSVAVLAPLAETQDESLGWAVVRALARLDLPEAVPPLIRAATKPALSQSADAVEALSYRDDARALAALADILDEPDARRRALAARDLIHSPRAEADELLLQHLDDPQPEARQAVVWSLGYRKCEAAVPRLAELLAAGETPEDRTAAAEALGRISSEAALDALRRVTPDTEPPGVPLAAGLALARDRDPAAVELLARNWVHAGDTWMVLGALTNYRGDDRAFGVLVSALEHEQASVRRHAVLLLGEQRDPRAADALAAFMARCGTDEMQLRLDAARGLLRLGDARGPEALEAMARDTGLEADLRLGAAGWLAVAEGWEDAYVALLTDLSADPDDAVAREARLRLRRLRHRRGQAGMLAPRRVGNTDRNRQRELPPIWGLAARL